jgi:hypothetical protein
MRRREFITSLFSGATAGVPLSARGEADGASAQRKQLLLDLQDANRRLAEAEEHLSQVHLLVYQMKCSFTVIVMGADLVRRNNHCELSDDELSDDVRVGLTLIDNASEHIIGFFREVFERVKARRKGQSACANLRTLPRINLRQG